MPTGYRNHFVNMARLTHRRGLALQKAGQQAQAFVKFVERDHLMQRARGI